jgi:hypothetical protein
MPVEKDSMVDEKISLDTSKSHEHQTNDNQCVVVHRPKETKYRWLFSNKSRMQNKQRQRQFRGHLFNRKNNIFFNINYVWLTWIKLINSKARITWLLSRLRSSRDRAKWYKMKREQMTEGIIRANKIPKMMERLNGVSSTILFHSLTSNEKNDDIKVLFMISVG